MKATQALALAAMPLGAFWACFNSLTGAAKYVNDMRESIVIGHQGAYNLSLEHRKALFLDWRLSMVGTVIAAFVYSAIIFWMAWSVKNVTQVRYLWAAIGLVGGFAFCSGLMFAWCGVSDFRLIRTTLNEAAHPITLTYGKRLRANPQVDAPLSKVTDSEYKGSHGL